MSYNVKPTDKQPVSQHI